MEKNITKTDSRTFFCERLKDRRFWQIPLLSIMLLLFGAVTNQAYADDCSGWDLDANANTEIKWLPDEGCFLVKCKNMYEFSNTNEEISVIRFYMNWAGVSLFVGSAQADMDDNTSKVYSVENKPRTDNIDYDVAVLDQDLSTPGNEVWVDLTPFSNSSYPQNNYCFSKSYKNNNDTYYRGITFKVFVDEEFLNKNITIDLDYDYENEHGGTCNNTVSRRYYTNITPFTPELNSATIDKDGKLTADIDFGFISHYEHVKSATSYTLRSFAGDYKTVKEEQGITTNNKIVTAQSSDWYDNSNYNKDSYRQKYANGPEFYLYQRVRYHKDFSPEYINKTSSERLRTASTAVFKVNKNLKITQNSRNIKITWDMLLPDSAYYSNEDMSDFEVQKWNGTSWVKVSDVEYKKDVSTYSYDYVLSDSEVQKGNVQYKFRVWKKRFNSIELQKDLFVSNENEITVNTDYKTVNILNVSNTDGIATVSWEYVPVGGNAIWDNKASLELQVTQRTGSATTINPISVTYDKNFANVPALSGCQTYDVRIVTSVLSATHHTTAPFEFDMPDNLEREITNFRASKGYYNNNVKLDWQIPADKGNFTSFNIERCAINSTDKVQLTQIIHNAGMTSYNYVDNTADAGVMYTYYITGWSECSDKPIKSVMEYDYGFSQPYAAVSGNISYEGNQAVEGVNIAVVANEGSESSSNQSIYFDGSEATARVELPAKTIDFSKNNEFTFQTWVKLSTKNANANPFIVDKQRTVTLSLINDNLSIYVLGQRINDIYQLTQEEWTQITFDVNLDTINATAEANIYVNGDSVYSGTITNLILSQISTYNNQNTVLGSSTGSSIEYPFKGNMDEVRFWNKVLSPEEVKNTYDRYLTGREEGLTAYYRFDEENINKVFDISGRGGVFNMNDGEMGTLATRSNDVPSVEQLANKAITDEDGNYLITTVPYTTEGVQYNVIPMLGVHEFNPSKRPIFASPSSVVFDNVNFTDVSSFEVNGLIYYENTMYPVEGANVYIDGNMCSFEGDPITTNDEGKFKISVPIGDHSITVKKHGHTFVSEGRYPADPKNVGTVHTFDRVIEEGRPLRFYDNTKVTVAGRVVGGQVETDKQLGFGFSKNNIGTAKITLSTAYSLNALVNVNGGVTSFENNPNTREVLNENGYVNSKATYNAGDADKVKTINIYTDSLTGEFSVEIPPVMYSINSVEIESNPEITFSGLRNIDATDPMKETKDSVMVDSVMRYSTYNVSNILTHRNTPTMIVTDNAYDINAYGEKEYVYTDLVGTDTISLFSTDDADDVTYAHGGPVFIQQNKYNFDIEAFELYENKDNAEILEDKVPMKNAVVTIRNQMSVSQSVAIEDVPIDETDTVKYGELGDLEDNQLVLDSLGKATYSWMAGFPNITFPYTRSLNITYDNNGKKEQWSQNGSFNGVVLGSLPSGNNFVTSGPDKVMMILRDPAGSASSAYWEEGVTVSTDETDGGSILTDNETKTTANLGLTIETVSGVGFAVVNSYEAKVSAEQGLRFSSEVTAQGGRTSSVTTTKRISTSDSEDFVGAGGDVFIGSATNIIFGNAREVNFERVNDSIVLNTKDAITTGSKFGTAFSYTQNYIENYLLPNLHVIRNQLLTTVSESQLDTMTNGTTEPIFVTSLSDSDSKFASRNFDEDIWGAEANDNVSQLSGPSYRMILPNVIDEERIYQDSVLWYNEQITMWTNVLADNEKAKLTAIEEGEEYLDENRSFDAGTSIESSIDICKGTSTTVDYQFETLVSLGGSVSTDLNGFGVALTTKSIYGSRVLGSHTFGKENCSTTGYTLAESGSSDALSIDVMKAPDGFGAIFVTRAGQTSCPYEGATVTKYYHPGTEISAATMQVEVPQIAVDNGFATDIPSGGTANYTLKLTNNSEIAEDGWFQLMLDDASNPNGAKITIDGSTLTANGRKILVPAGQEITKSIQLTQTQAGVLEYNNIKVIIASQCQSSISDTVELSAQFVPSCTNVTLEVPKRTMNASTGSELDLVIKDYDLSYYNFKALRLQYKHVGDVDWKTTKEYVVSEDGSNEIIPAGGRINVAYDMSNSEIYPDGKYEFRVLTACVFGSEEVYNESETIVITKDMAKPLIMGVANPVDGILDADDQISVIFNEDIRNGELKESSNFVVTGVLNDATISHNTAIKLNGEALTASTDAKVHLAGNEFTFDMWINFAEMGGTIIEHGAAKNKFAIATTAEGLLTVLVGETLITSTAAVPMNKWCFISVNYTIGDDNRITALLADDASNTRIIDNIVVPEYKGTGNLKLGINAKASIHELCMWNKARTNAESISEMYNTKAASTMNLVGYWRMNEGHGILAKDLARNRHILLGSEAWYINNVNLSADVTANSTMDINISTCSANTTDDYMMEMWFRGAAQTNAMLWSVGEDMLGIMFDANGKLAIKTAEGTTVLSNNNYLDNTWHHIALNVLRNGATVIYVDDIAVKQLASSAVPAFAGAYLTIGGERYRQDNTTYLHRYPFVGQVDELRYWIGNYNAKMIADNRFDRLDVEDELGLMAYYPFEVNGLDAGGQPIATFTLEDKSINNAGAAVVESVVESNNAPALKEAEELTNVGFNFTASEREIIINVNEDANRIEATTLNFTIKDIHDMNNNLSEPVSWSVYVNRNRLVWDDDVVNLSVDNNQETTFSVSISNLSAVTESWTISNMPSWLSVSESFGNLSPLSNKELVFTISSATPIGNYEEMIYLSGLEGINKALTLNLKVSANAPEWTVNPSDYESSMNIIGQLNIDGEASYNTDDKVAAFIGNSCVGVASPVYYQRYDAYYVIMDIYANNITAGDAVTFKVWDASNGRIYPVVTLSEDVNYSANTLKGSMDNPFIWNAENMQEQSMSLAAGWNWMSLSIVPNNPAIESVLSSIQSTTEIVKDKESLAVPNSNDWKGTLKNVEVGNMYKINLKEVSTLNVIGNVMNPTEYPVTLNPNWNWIGFNSQYIMNIGDAFADANPQDGDMVKGQTGFAVYQDYEWVGTLKGLTPGRGYMYMSVADEAKDFTYPSVSTSMNAPMFAPNKVENEFTAVESNTYSGNMTIIAQLIDSLTILSNTEIGVFVGEECRSAEISNEDGLVFLTIAGENAGDILNFRLVVNGTIVNYDSTVIYVDDAMIGTLDNPYIIKLNKPTAETSVEYTEENRISVYPTKVIDIVNIKSENSDITNVQIIDAAGRIIADNNVEFNNTITTMNMNSFASGVYIIKVTTADNRIHLERVIR